jgi:cytochrome c oxidase subunit 2
MNPNLIPFFPPEASTQAFSVDWFFLFMLVVCGAAATLVCILIIYFGVKYRRSNHPKAEDIHGNTPLELAWTIIPGLIFLVMFFWSANIYFQLTRPPANAIVIHVVGKQWMWKIQHPGGQREINELHIPMGQPVQLELISEDVIHDFFIPAFRTKWDVLPGQYRTIWFEAVRPGKYHFFCSQYCGTEHSKMRGFVYVMRPNDYQAWLAQSHAEGSMADEGLKIFQDYSCITCHRADSSTRGPNIVGLYGSVVHLQDGTSVLADDNYLRTSILDPSAQIVAGFRNIMPSFQGQLSEEQILDLIEYFKSVSQREQMQPIEKRSYNPAGPRPGEAPPVTLSPTAPANANPTENLPGTMSPTGTALQQGKLPSAGAPSAPKTPAANAQPNGKKKP